MSGSPHRLWPAKVLCSPSRTWRCRSSWPGLKFTISQEVPRANHADLMTRGISEDRGRHWISLDASLWLMRPASIVQSVFHESSPALNRSPSWRYVAPTGSTRIATGDSENPNPWDFRGIANCDPEQPRTTSWSGSAAHNAEVTDRSRANSSQSIISYATFMTSGLHIHRPHDGKLFRERYFR
jgi:hypothetical protein